MSIPGAKVGSLLLEGVCRHALKDPADTIVAIRRLGLIVLNGIPLKEPLLGTVIQRGSLTYFVESKCFRIPTGDLEKSCRAFQST